ncbi:MAG: 16S rRNA (cytosine(1402)-N(4))-methyltransferase RsmH [Candidatus Liptonbacteria bacterium]|nr:16S rRNA (cytosine(1402)-N(4))-methyltransferase RsmH [Candidatus Liptonbacteria bacterium]
MHIPVLLQEVLQYLDPKPGEFIADGTVDGGGHARAILPHLAPGGTFLGVDWDSNLLDSTRRSVHAPKVRAIWVHGNYAELDSILGTRQLPKLNGLLLDLGLSSEQLAGSGRGFSFQTDEPLQMTYDDQSVPLHKLLPQMSEADLTRIIRTYGEERYAPRIARAIKSAGKITTSGELTGIIARAIRPGPGKIHPATRTFQALRMYANRELDNLSVLLGELPELLAPGGRVVIISFHSLEDRLVKQSFRDLARSGCAELLTPKPVTASREEVRANPRSRSAKLRALIINH